MSKHLVPHIKKANVKDGAAANETKAGTIGGKLTLSGNVVLVPQGAIVTTSGTQLHDASVDNINKKLDSKTATTTKNSKNQNVCDKINASGILVEQQMPGDADGWRAMGFEVTMEEVPDTVQCAAPVHCSVSQGDELGTADVHHDPIENADDYFVFVTKGAADVRASYIDVTNTDESTAKSSSTVTLPLDYLGVPLNWIVAGHNSVGMGIDSVPFGGGRKIN